jgi:ribosomal protein S7
MRKYSSTKFVSRKMKRKIARGPVLSDFLGMEFYGISLFSLYLQLFLAEEAQLQSVRRLLHFHIFFFNNFRFQIEGVFTSFLVHKLTNSLMIAGNKSVVEALIASIFSQIKLFSGVLGSSVVIGTAMALRSGLVRTLIFLAGRGHVVPTPSVLDKQCKLSIRTITKFVRKRYYKYDVFRRSILQGRLIARRVPLYRRVVRLGALLVKTQSFYNILHRKYQGSRFLKNDVLGSLRKSLYQLILYRTYIQYRWR